VLCVIKDLNLQIKTYLSMNKRSFLQKFALVGASLWFLPQALFASPTEATTWEAEV
jgi:hypothetical protein